MAPAAADDVTPDEIEQIKEVFERADKGGGGKITREALGGIFKSLQTDEPWTEKDLNDLFDLLDGDKNGFISYNEFVHYIMSDEDVSMKSQEAQLEQHDYNTRITENHAAHIDPPELDLNQLLTKEEFCLLASKLGDDYEEAEAVYDMEWALAEEDDEITGDGLPLHALLMAIKIQGTDLRAMNVVKLHLANIRTEITEGVATKVENDILMRTGVEKVLSLLLAWNLPFDQAPEVSKKAYLSASCRQVVTRTLGNDKNKWTKMLNDYETSPPALPANAGMVGAKLACQQKVQRIIDECKAAGNKYTDPDWDVLNDPKQVLYVDKEKPGYDCTVGKPVAWKRLTELVDAGKVGGKKAAGDMLAMMKQANNKLQLFKGGVRPGDILQGQLGDCYLLGALGALVSYNEKSIRSLFVKYDIDVGVFGVIFNVNGDWVYVVVDDYMPVNHFGDLLFARSADRMEIWVPVLEKAFCKLHTCYEMCDGGHPCEAIFAFCGGCSGRFAITEEHKEKPETYFALLKIALERGWILTTAFNPPKKTAAAQGKCGESVLDCGLVGGHVYSVLSVVNVKDLFLIQCRNPWGQGEWLGKWSDKNAEGEWTEELDAATGHTYEDDGKFWMSMEDFVNNSSGVNFSRVFGPPWMRITAYQKFADTEVRATAIYAFKATKDDEISFSKGDEIDVDVMNKGWWTGAIVGQKKIGYFPGNYVKLKDRPVTRYDLKAAPNEGDKIQVPCVIVLMQDNVCLKRKFFQRKVDGLNYKDTSYPEMQLIILKPDGLVEQKIIGKRRELFLELVVGSTDVHRIYCLSMDGLVASFRLRVYFKDGSVTLTKVPADIHEVADAIK